MPTEYINYRIWPDGTYVNEDDYVESDYAHMSDDWFLLPLPAWFSEETIDDAITNAIQGFYPYA